MPKSVGVGVHNKSITGEMVWTLDDEFGGLKEMRYVPNLITNNGVQYALSFLLGLANTSASSAYQVGVGAAGGSGQGFQYIAVGTGAGTISVSSVQLATENDRISSAFTQPAFNQWQEQSTFGTGRAVGALTEASVANSSNSNGGIMFAGTNYAVVNKLSGDTLTVTWVFTVSGS